MRKHQYRGQRVDTKEWVYGKIIKVIETEQYFILPLESNIYDGENTPNLIKKNNGMFIIVEAVEVIPETVGEFTGRKDINGIGAYEGDICETIERDVAMEIRWDEELSAFKFYDNVHKLWFDLDCLEVVEITDSIHDNQELMK